MSTSAWVFAPNNRQGQTLLYRHLQLRIVGSPVFLLSSTQSSSRGFTCPPSAHCCACFSGLDQDLNFFADNMWKLGMNVTAGKFLFLGDYVDRGMQGLECLAYLFSLKAGVPSTIPFSRRSCSGYPLASTTPLLQQGLLRSEFGAQATS